MAVKIRDHCSNVFLNIGVDPKAYFNGILTQVRPLQML